jgi:hypothetical protein
MDNSERENRRGNQEWTIQIEKTEGATFGFLSLNCPLLIAPSVFLNVYLHTYATAQCAGLLQVHYHGSILLKVSMWPYDGKHEGLVHFVMLMK